MLAAADPNTTTKSIMSVNSANLERINQRNTERLAKLEAVELTTDYSQILQPANTSVTSQNFPSAPPNRDPSDSTLQRALRQNPEPLALRNQDGQGRTELQELDDMLADILK